MNTQIVTQVKATDKLPWIVADLDELEYLAQQLDLLRQGIVAPVAMMTPEQHEAVEHEAIGEHHSMFPYKY